MIDEEQQKSTKLSRLEQHRFIAMLVGAIIIAAFLVGVSMALYNSSGAAQLDLSRPGYQSVRDQAVSTDSFDSFPASGPIDKAALDQFRELYAEQSKDATNVDAFSGDVISDKALSIDAPE